MRARGLVVVSSQAVGCAIALGSELAASGLSLELKVGSEMSGLRV